uniref:Uncharacterized protein n=1 Tax=Acrobeloides nanus TaxID=290746 RepID=A0A914CFJ5_9BILA
MAILDAKTWFNCCGQGLLSNIFTMGLCFLVFITFLEALYLCTYLYAYGPQIWEDYIWNYIGFDRKDEVSLKNNIAPDVTQMSMNTTGKLSNSPNEKKRSILEMRMSALISSKEE